MNHKIHIIITVICSFYSCSNLSFKNSCDPNSETFYSAILLKSLIQDHSPNCNLNVSREQSPSRLFGDGSTWTARTSPIGNWVSIAYGNGTFVAVADSGNIAATSPDGTTWTTRTLPSSASWYSIAYGNGVFVTVAYNSAKAATSPDGINWTARALPNTSNWYTVAYGDGVFAALSFNSSIAATSP